MEYDHPVDDAVFSPDGTKLATAGTYFIEHPMGKVRLWDTATAKSLGTLIRYDGKRDVVFSPDGTKLATANADDGTAQLWDTATGKPRGEPMKLGKNSHINAFSPDSMTLATANADDGTAQLWDAATGKPHGERIKLPRGILTLAFSPDGAKLATEGADFSVQLWDAATGKPLTEPMNHGSPANTMVFGPDGADLVTASDDKAARLRQISSGESLMQTMKHQDVVIHVVFSPDGKKIATAGFDHTARLWDATTGRALCEPMKHAESVLDVAFSPDGTKLATTSIDKTAQLWDATTGRALCEPMMHAQRALNPEHVYGIAFSPDGTKLATIDRLNTGNKLARLWDAAIGRPLGTPMSLRTHRDRPFASAFSPDGMKLAVASEGWQNDKGDGQNDDGRAVRLWEVWTGKPLGAPMKYANQVTHVAFSPDGTELVTVSTERGVGFGSSDGIAQLWGVATGKPLGAPMRHDLTITAVAFSRAGTKLATASLDKTARLWDATTGKPLGEPLKHDDEVRAVAFSPNDTMLATGSGSQESANRDGLARLWDVVTGKPLGRPFRHGCCVAFSPDGAKLAGAGVNNTARLWRVPRPLPDDPRFVAAYVNAVSAWKEDESATLHRMTAAETAEEWEKVLSFPSFLSELTRDRTRRLRDWHANEATEHEAAGRWFAAAFHLRWLCKLEPNNGEWRQRLTTVEEHLASAAKGESNPDKLPIDSGKAPADRKEPDKQ